MGSKVKVEEADFHELMSLTKELQQTLTAEHERTHALSHELDRYEKENKTLKHDLSETRQESRGICCRSRRPSGESEETNASEACT